MKEFIHTFSAITYVTLSEKEQLQHAFREDFFYNSAEKLFVISKYAEQGLRIQIKFTKKKEKQFDKQHRDCKIEWIVTPAKLIYPGETMKRLLTAEEYTQACERLEVLFKEIEQQSGVYLGDEIKIRRLDIGKDIITPSNEYSREVIRLGKLALHQNGYHLWVPNEQDIEKTGWAEADSCMFYNHNQEVNAKIYNKLEDLKKNNHDISDITGMLRFEVSLKRKFLIRYCGMHMENLILSDLPALLGHVINQASDLMRTHMIGPLQSGHMLSKELQKKYIRCRYKGDKKRQKMFAYRRVCNRNGIIPHGRVVEYFEEIALSPLYTSEEIRYIPSFANLLAETEDETFKRFLSIY